MSPRPRVTASELASIDLADPRLHAERDLTEIWRHLREHEPVHWHQPDQGERPGFWVITRYRDVTAVYRDSERFSSEPGNVLDTLLAGRDSAGGQMLAVTDGTRHAELRALVARGFTAASLAPVVAGVREGTSQLMADAVERGPCDFASEVAARIPLAATCALLGVPSRDWDYILSLTSSALGSDHGVPTEADTFTAKNEILLYFADLAADRRQHPGDDLVSLLAVGQAGSRSLTEREVVFNCYSILLGGDETTRLAMIGAVLALAEHPAQWRALKDGQVSLESAIEEILRWTTPALHSGRTASGDFSFGGKFIESGDIVTVWPAAANWDEERFLSPEEFDLSRAPNKHLTFTYGPHFCIGAQLARVEIGSVLAMLRETVADIELTGESRRVYSNFLSGMSSLPVILHPEATHSAAVDLAARGRTLEGGSQ